MKKSIYKNYDELPLFLNAKTEKECEIKLAELIKTMKSEIEMLK